MKWYITKLIIKSFASVCLRVQQLALCVELTAAFIPFIVERTILQIDILQILCMG